MVPASAGAFRSLLSLISFNRKSCYLIVDVNKMINCFEKTFIFISVHLYLWVCLYIHLQVLMSQKAVSDPPGAEFQEVMSSLV